MNFERVLIKNHHVPLGYMTALSRTNILHFDTLTPSHIPSWYMRKTYKFQSYLYENRITMLDNRAYFLFKDFSIPKHDPIHNAPNQKLLMKQSKDKYLPVTL